MNPSAISRLTIRASCTLDLRYLPLDTQRCSLFIGSFAYDSEETIYEWNKMNSVDVQSDLIMNQFSLINTSVGSHILVRDNRKCRRAEGSDRVLCLSSCL